MMRYLMMVALVAAAASAVELGPFPVLKVIDGSTIEVTIDAKEERVRLLYVDTPEAKDNKYGNCMHEGGAAKAFLSELLSEGAHAYLWGPGETLERDRFGRVLAVVTLPYPILDEPIDFFADPGIRQSIQLAIIRAGWSPLWLRHSSPPEPLLGELQGAQKAAEEAKAGAWTTALEWMRDKANERPDP